MCVLHNKICVLFYLCTMKYQRKSTKTNVGRDGGWDMEGVSSEIIEVVQT